MNRIIKSTLESKMTIVWIALFSINSLCTCVVASMAGSVWSLCDTQTKFTMIVAIIGNWTGTMMAYMKQNLKKIEKGQLPFDENTAIAPKEQSEKP